MPSLTMEVCHCGQRYIGRGALHVHQLYIIFLVDCLLYRYGATHIPLHAAAYYCCVLSYVLFSNVRPSPYFGWQQLQRRGGLTGVCIAAVSQPGVHWMKQLSFGWIQIVSHRAEVCVEPWLAVVEQVRQMITKSAQSWVIYSKLQVTREWMTVNSHILLKLYPAAYRCKLHVIPTVPWFAASRSDDVCLFVCLQGYLQVNDSWYLMFDGYKKEILRRKSCLVMFVSTHSRDLTCNRG